MDDSKIITHRNMEKARGWMMVAALNGFMVIGMGAYGQHGLDDQPQYLINSFNIGVQYQMWHALALMGVAWMVAQTGSRIVRLAGVAFTVGTILFSGALYTFGITGDVPFTGSAPIGGYSLMAGWALLGIGAWRGLRRD
jgi:uncharacterized membrane protein YgdD (TMEM256/DUF423 family)